jgi:hypothetical protein
MRKLLSAFFVLCSAVGAHAQSTSHSWIDVTASPYNAKSDCSVDAGSAIASAINNAPAGSGVIFFPTGCYLIQTQIVDKNGSASLAYLGEGNVELRASSTTPPSNSIIQLGNDTTTVTLRKIVNIKFNCNAASIDGIDLDGLADSEFDSVSILSCHGSTNWHMRTVGNNQNQYGNVFIGGLIDADAPDENGISLGANSSGPAANAWSFFGAKILGNGSSPTGTGLDFEGAGSTFYGGAVSGWGSGINLVVNNPNITLKGGFEISGSYIENNKFFGIRVGDAGFAGDKAAGVTISGNYINCNNVGQTGVELEQTNGFSVTGNHIRQCTVHAIRGLADGTNQGADNGFFGANFIDGGQPSLIQGSNNTTTNSISTQSAAYTLTGTDAWVNVTGNTTITVPHAMTAQRWDVFNSGTGNVSLVCDRGTINGGASYPVASQTGKTVTTDRTNCFAH